MDKRIRRNELCIIGQPSCDFVFSSTRSCFIGYGFTESVLEMTIIRNLLEKRNIQPIEAGGYTAPAQNAYCKKICSKIITSQFCIILLNNDIKNNREIPNANVNMEYGLMLGFNKYIIPFQKKSQSLPFNVSGLDTIKYTDQEFETKAKKEIDKAIIETKQTTPLLPNPDYIIQSFILSKKAMVTPLDAVGDKQLFQLGAQLGFNLLNDFAGLNYIFLGNFTMLRLELILWRFKMLRDILNEREESLRVRLESGIVTEKQIKLIKQVLKKLQIWLVVTSKKDKENLLNSLKKDREKYKVQIFSLEDIDNELLRIT